MLRGSQKKLPVYILFFVILRHIFFHTFLDTIYWIKQVADRKIVIQSVDDQCDIFAHITSEVIGFA